VSRSEKARHRVLLLQRALKTAREALDHIAHGCKDPVGVAEEATVKILQLELQMSPTLTMPEKGKDHGR
jgi:hypothetical protein